MAKVPLHIMLRRARKQRGLTQGQVADLIGVAQATLSAHERGRELVPKGRLLRLAEILTLDPQEALDALAKAEQVLRCCCNPHCPSTSPYEVGEEILYRPRFVTADAIKRLYCQVCGDVMLRACERCNAPLEDGAACPQCGTFYVAPSVAQEIADEQSAALRRMVDREREYRRDLLKSLELAPKPTDSEEGKP